MSAYSCRVPNMHGCLLSGLVVVIELGAYIHGVLTFNGCLFSRFYGMCTYVYIRAYAYSRKIYALHASSYAFTYAHIHTTVRAYTKLYLCVVLR